MRRHEFQFARLLARDVRQKPKDIRLGVIADLSVSFLRGVVGGVENQL